VTKLLEKEAKFN
jgi:hypothetical protein